MMKSVLPELSMVAQNYPASGIRKMFDLAAQYDDVINLTVGEPDFDTPCNIKEAAKKALDEGYTHYSPNAGLPELREAIAEKYKNYWDGYTKDNVIVTVGALEALSLVLSAAIDPGDEVIVQDPGYPNYYGQILIAGGKAVTVPCYEKNGYRVQAEDIEKVITPKTKAIILNSPSNPLGSVLEKEDILKIAQVVKKHNLFVFSDEPYDKLIYDGQKFFSIAQVPEIRSQVFVLNSFSKSYAMTGWRVGYILADAAYTPVLGHLQEGFVSCVATFLQKAAVEALKGPQDAVAEMVASYARRRDLLIDGLNSIPGFRCKKSPGSFYAFANIEAFGKTSQEFAEELIKNARVVTVPGSSFGKMGEGHLRFVFANSDENLAEAVRRIKEYVIREYGEHPGEAR